MSILEEFWCGNLDPAEYDACPSKDYKEMLQLISRNEDCSIWEIKIRMAKLYSSKNNRIWK